MSLILTYFLIFIRKVISLIFKKFIFFNKKKTFLKYFDQSNIKKYFVQNIFFRTKHIYAATLFLSSNKN